MSNVPFYKADKIADGTWHIMYGFTDREHVRCYLIEGRDYALVIDTMNGFGKLRQFVETLTDKPLKLANTHFHFDHAAGNFDFDECWMHHADIKYFVGARPNEPEKMLEYAEAEAFEKYRGQMDASDFCASRDMKVYPLYDGDKFDLGDREILVVDVGGHTPGSIVLIDPVTRICFSGDACNGNTLMQFDYSLSVETYLKNLLHFKKFQSMFDVMYGGHQIMRPETIDEAIVMCAKVIAGMDDRDVRPGIFGTPSVYGSRPIPENEDGPHFNICYDPENVLEKAKEKQIIR